MWPWGHLAVGYLLYSTYTRYRFLRRPAGAPVVWLAVGTQFPDIVDKPVAYWTPLLPGGRSFAHSLLVLVPVLTLLHFAATSRSARRGAVAFGIGYVSHVFADGIAAVAARHPEDLTYLVWPLLPLPEYSKSDFGHHAGELVATVGGADARWLLAPWSDFFVAQLWLTSAAIGLWIVHGLPPLPSLRDTVRS